ncbi:MAG TPA: hypothetical protein GXX36_07665 [Clostridiaceae bacterium]|nr:hypothetical protein [Clostridiaceae bacterium]
MFMFRRRRARITKKSKPDKPAKTETATAYFSSAASFSSHISKYIGKTVTVFVNAGGPSGCGFTGILSDVDNTALKLIVSIGPPPSCSLKNLCYPNYYHNPYFIVKHYNGFYMPQACKPILQIGSVAHILLSSITAFVHNSI